MKHAETLDYTTVDSEGNTPNLGHINTRWQHLGNGKTYLLVDYVWNGQSDTWMFLMEQPDGSNLPPVVRPLSHLVGIRQDGEPRYTKVS